MIENETFHLEFSNFITLINEPSKRKSLPNSSPLKINQIFLSLLTSILTDAGQSFGKDLLDAISHIVYRLLQEISNSENIYQIVNKLLELFDPKCSQTMFSAAKTTIQTHLPEKTKLQLDEQLEEDYTHQMQIRRENHAQSRILTLVIDNTHDKASSKHLNNQYSYIRIGQRKTWERGFTYSGIYDATHQAYLGLLHLNDHKVKRDRRALQPWIVHLQKKIAVVEASGSEVELIEADRGYFDSEFFALSYIGRLRGFDKSEKFVRVITPKKFTREKENTKWNYLLSKTSTKVSVQNMDLNFYSNENLLNACEEMHITKENGIFKIPVAQVVLVDEYGSKFKRTFEMIKLQAQELEKNLKLASEHFKSAEKKYIDFKSHRGDKKPKFVFRRKKKRSKFKSAEEKLLYYECDKLKEQIEMLNKEKENIMHSVTFFYISIALNEDPCLHPEKYIRLARDYHERWGIENGFKDVKYKFLYKSRSQRPTRRQYYWILGLMLYNHWQTEKWLDLLSHERKRVHNIVPWNSRRPHIRKKLEKSIHTDWTAKGYLLRLWETGLNICLKLILAK